MSKSEVFEKMMNSENGGLYAAIGGIVLVYSIDRITKSHYKADVKKDSITLAPAGDADKPLPQETEKEQKIEKGGVRTLHPGTAIFAY